MHLSEFLAAALDRSEWREQVALLSRVAAALESNAACRGAAVVGSLAAGTADRLSDIDLVVFCEAGAADTILDDLRQVSTGEDVLYKLGGRHDAASRFEKVIHFNLLSYEFHAIEPTTPFSLKAPYIAVVDKNGCLASRFSPEAPPRHDTRRPHANGDAGLSWELFNCIKALSRGQVDEVRGYLVKLASALGPDNQREA